MKYLRLIVLMSIFISSLLLQACGSGGGTSDTAGALTISTPTKTDNKDGSYTVTVTVTYAPPAGKTAQGVVVTTKATDNLGRVSTDNATLTSGSNSVIYSYNVTQAVGFSSSLSIVSNIGGMVAGVSVIIPPIAPLSATLIQFTTVEGSGVTHTTTISGGIEPYQIISITPASPLSVSLAGATLSVTNSTTGVTPASAIITIIDQTGSSLQIPVNYFTP